MAKTYWFSPWIQPLYNKKEKKINSSPFKANLLLNKLSSDWLLLTSRKPARLLCKQPEMFDWGDRVKDNIIVFDII